jgi:hypothetical protein
MATNLSYLRAAVSGCPASEPSPHWKVTEGVGLARLLDDFEGLFKNRWAAALMPVTNKSSGIRIRGFIN